MAIPELASLPVQPSDQILKITRKLPIGAEVQSGGVHFRVWAPGSRRVCVVLSASASQPERVRALEADGSGYFSALSPEAVAGMTYSYRLDDLPELWPDPASRFQPDGPRGSSAIIDPSTFAWHDAEWPGVRRGGRCCTRCTVAPSRPGDVGRGAAAPGRFGRAGRDGDRAATDCGLRGELRVGLRWANLSLRRGCTARPTTSVVLSMRRTGLASASFSTSSTTTTVALASRSFAPSRRPTSPASIRLDWGTAVNFDDDGATEVRALILANADYWIREFHLDGYRVDATQSIEDDSPRHILQELTKQFERRRLDKQLLIVGENEPQRTVAAGCANGGYEFDALWNDDFHHAAMVRLTGRREAYYSDYHGSAEEFLAVRWGFLFQGQRDSWRRIPAEPRDWTWEHNSSSPSCRITTNWQTRPTGRGFISSRVRPLSGDDGRVSCFFKSPCCFKARSSRRRRHSSTSMTVQRTNNRQYARDARISRTVPPVLATAAMQARLNDPCDRLTFMRSKLTMLKDNVMERLIRCIATCCGYGVKIRFSTVTTRARCMVQPSHRMLFSFATCRRAAKPDC